MTIPEALLGLDIGQTRVKAVLLDHGGRELAMSAGATQPSHPHPGWAEHDLRTLRETCLGTVREVLAAVPGARITGIGVSGHSDGLYLVDRRGDQTRPAILATDARASALARQLSEGLGGRDLLQLTGQLPMSSSPGPLLQWVREHEPRAYESAVWALSSTDWLRLLLTGEAHTDTTMAAAGFVALGARSWSRDVLERFGLLEVESILPPVLESRQLAGRVSAEIAAETGLPEGTPVVAGAHDVDAGALGLGAVDGATTVLLGTYSINQVLTSRPVVGEQWQVRPYVEPGQWLHMSTSPAGAGSVDWIASAIGPHHPDGGPDSASAVAEGLAEVDSVAAPLFLPFVHGGPAGAPVGGSWIGLRSEHDRASMLAAALEGVAFGHRAHLEALASRLPVVGPVLVGGGATRSEGWTQLLCDVVGLPLVVTRSAEVSARGAALLAGVGTGVFDTVSEAAATAVPARRHEPDPEIHERSTSRFARYRAAVDALAGIPD